MSTPEQEAQKAEEARKAAVKKSLADIEARREARRLAAESARDEQRIKDLEAVEALEAEFGVGRVTLLAMPSFVPGLPTLIAVRTPEESYQKRYRDQIRKAGQNLEKRGEATDLLASSSIAYPDEPTYRLMLAKFPGIHASAYVAAVKLGEAETLDAGKG